MRLGLVPQLQFVPSELRLVSHLSRPRTIAVRDGYSRAVVTAISGADVISLNFKNMSVDAAPITPGVAIVSTLQHCSETCDITEAVTDSSDRSVFSSV